MAQAALQLPVCTLKHKSKSDKHFSRKRLREQLLHSPLWQAATNERSQLVQACGSAQDMFSRVQKSQLQVRAARCSSHACVGQAWGVAGVILYLSYGVFKVAEA